MANFNIDYLVVAGGGGAGAAGAAGSGSGGGGAGGLLTSIGSTTLTLNASVAYDVIVGAGGSGAVSVVTPRYTGGDNGSDSEFSGTGITTITAIGGGGGGSGNGSGSNCNNCLPNAGGSGGGTGYGGSGALGTPGQGNSGGISASGSPYAASGGGGAGGAGSGAPNSSTGGNGGLGLTNSITVASGTGPFYAGGGGGSPSYNGTGVGGSGGSGIGGYGTSGLIGGDGSPNTGSGGGAGSPTSSGNSTGGTGSSGIVILRYTTADITSYTTTGSTPTEDTTTVPGQTILSFTTVGTGTITFTIPTPTPFDGTKVTNPVTGFNSATEKGLKLPSGTNANMPLGVEGMIRNNTEESIDNSASVITYYNGTEWQYFSATESPDNPLPAGAQIVYSANDTASYPGTGTTWFDISGNSNDATLTNTTYSNGYLSFNGSSSKVTTSYSTNTSNASFAAWVNCNNVSTYNNFIGKGYYSNSNNANYVILVNYANASPVFTIRLNGLVVSAQSSVAMTNNTWHHLVGTVSSTGDMKIYLDGTQTGSQTGAPARNMTQILLSGVYLDGNQQFFSGEISKIQVYDTVLTAADVTDLYNAGSGTT